jgi:autotransporter-associated beta strand protein
MNGKLYVNDTISGMSSGSLHVNYQSVGATGTGMFTQNGGTNSIGSLNLGSQPGCSGTYILSGTGQLSASAEYIGYSDKGTFFQTGGTNTITSALMLGYNSNVSGTYNLNGGKLILKSITKGSGTAAFNFGGGTLQASNNLTTTMPMTLTGDGGVANIDTAGYTATLSGVLSGTSGLNKLGAGTLTLSALNTYSGDTIVNGGTLEIAGGIASSGTSLIDVQSGTAVLKTVNVNKPDLDITTAALATFEVVNGTHIVGTIDGSGITQVDAGATLTVTFIRQGTLTGGIGAKIIIQPSADGPLGNLMTPVPEPSAFILLAGAFIFLACPWARKKARERA